MSLLSKILGLGNRQMVLHGRDFEWSDKSWTHNVFRAFEVVFGRKCGLRIEMTSGYVDGVEYHYAHTFEASVALIESFVRGLVTKASSIRVWIPVLATPTGIPVPVSPYLFAIAFDTASEGAYQSAATALTWNHTVSGSNTFMAAGILHQLANTNINAKTYNSVTMTQAQFNDGSLGAFATLVLYYLVAPTTGTNAFNFTATTTSGEAYMGFGSSFSGAKQTGQPDSSNKDYTASGISTITVNTTVVASDCWLVGIFDCGGADTTMAAGAGTTARYAPSGGYNVLWGDSNGTVSTGSQGLTGQRGSGTSGMQGSVLSIAPVAASGPTNLKSLDGNVAANIKSYCGNLIANIKSISGNS